MATSSTFPTTNQFVVYNITATEGAYDIEKNNSPLTVSVRFWRTNTGYETYGTGKLYCRINGSLYSQNITPYDGITNSGITLFEKTVTIPHNADGSKTVEITAWIDIYDVVTSEEQGFSVALATIPRASTPTLSANRVDIGQSITIYTNRLASSFTHTVKYTWNGTTKNIATNVGESTAWTVPTSFLSGIPNKLSGEVIITLVTLSGGKEVGSKTVKLTVVVPAGSNPIFTDFAVGDVNGATSALTGDNTMLVQDYSQVRVVISAANRATSPSGATIVKYIASCGNRSAEVAWSSSGNAAMLLGTVSSGVVSVAAVDSRGQQTVVQKILTLIPYFPPVLRSVSLTRKNGVGEETTLTFRAEIFTEAIGKTTNKVDSISYTWKEGDTFRTGATAIPAQTSWSGKLKGDTDAGFSASKSFTLDLMISDMVTTKHFTIPLDSGVPVLDVYRKGTTAGAAVNKRWEHGALDVGGMIYMDNKSLLDFFYPVNSVYISYSHTNPGTLFGGTWQRITNAFLWAAGASDSIGATGGEKTHTLTADELPKLSGGALFRDIDLGDSNLLLQTSGIFSKSTTAWEGTHAALTTEDKTSGYLRNRLGLDFGGDKAHNNMPPYVQVSIWRRTA